jgi:ribonuclease P protein subunit POP4
VKRENADVARSELIGLRVTVASRHPGWDGLEGLVVDETKHTLVVERTSRSEAVVPKSGQRFSFLVGNEGFVVRDGVGRHAGSTTGVVDPGAQRRAGSATVVVDGDEIMFRPEDRTKKVRS